MNGLKMREFRDKNYRAIFTPSGKTVHFRFDKRQPLQKLDWPELYDIGINSKCFGECSYCYIEAIRGGTNFENIVEKVQAFFGRMTENQKPFQVAIGASGEPTLHPDFPEFLKALYDMGIMPNYTSNGMHLGQRVIKATQDYCGGVALTTHRHLERYWRKGITKLVAAGIRTNLHIVIVDKQSVDESIAYWKEYKDEVEFFVLLPYQAVGFAEEVELAETYDYLFDSLRELDDTSQFAYGAYFIDELKKRPYMKADLYPHDAISKYMSLQGTGSMHASSFDWETALETDLF
jgi:MoaA/NifB/PqqE/SkfB family radical SAM enzyme